jgi:predicted nucleic acid-binding protein
VIRALFDTNVILDLLLVRQPRYTAAAALWRAHVRGRLSAYVTATSLTDIFYVVRRTTTTPDALAAVHAVATTLIVIGVDHGAVLDALAMPGSDFEDNLQIACSQVAGLDLIVTRDADGFGASPISVVSPDEALALLNAPQSGDQP